MFKKWAGWKKVAACLMGGGTAYAGRKRCHGCDRNS